MDNEINATNPENTGPSQNQPAVPTVQYDLKNNVPLPTKTVPDSEVVTPPVQGHTQPTNVENKGASESPQLDWDSDENPYKKKFSASTDEAMKMKKYIEANQEKIVITDNLVERMKSDPEFAEGFKSLTAKEKKQVAQAISDAQAPAQPGQPAATLDIDALPEPYRKVLEKGVQQEQQEEVKKQQYFETLEGENKDLIAKFDKVAPDGKMYNPVKGKIFDDTMFYMNQMNMSFEDAATAAFNENVSRLSGKPAMDPKQAKAQGMIEGMESKTIANYSGGSSTSKTDDTPTYDDYTKSIMAKMKISIDDKNFKKVWQQNNAE